MFSRALLVALCVVYATSLTPLTPLAPLTASADDDCALYLTGPGRSSAYDYSLNLLKGNFAYDGQHTCITYEAINQAYLDARTRILVSQPKGDWKAEDFASVGELILDISISLARTYGLTYEEIEKGLPLIDTSRTLIREACPPVFSHVECRAGKYRRLDGLCNNLKHPTWGATMAPFQRLIGPLFSDGINAPRISHTGHDLPLSRVVSRTMHPDDGFHDHAGTVMVIAWGQFMDHDYTLTGTPLDPVHRNDPEECCKRPPHLKHPYCNEIRVPDDDYFYRLFGVKCIDFVRGFPSPRPGCRLGSRVPFNTLTGAIDGNTVYGVTEKFARKLRTGYGGLLRMNPVFKEYGLKDLLPLKLDIPDEGCTRPNKNMYCFEAGEIRVNEQLVLTVMHTLMAREHNRVAEALAQVNPHWDDESLFQEARRINIAEIQHITYNEFLPILLGKDVMEKFGLVLAKEGYWEGYDEEVNPDVIASFAAAAYRFGHSLLPTAVERWSKAHKFIASKRLSDLIRRPYDLYRAGVLDEYVMGLMNQVAQAMDDSITQEVTNHLFKKVGARFGMDLVSFNMQRGREFGLPGYMEFRKFCGLSGADTFQDLFGSMPNETIRKYESIFEHPVDVDLWSGGVSERPLPGSMLGPTFACVIATQFSYSRRGDRFWFELPNQPSSFTPEQLAEIRKSRLARIICDNTDIIDTVQLYPMVLPDHELNPRVPCRSGIIPSMDFSKWADPVPFLGGAKEYMTNAFIFNGTASHSNQTAKICNNENGNCTSKETFNLTSLDNVTSTDYNITVNSTEKDILCTQNENNTACRNDIDKSNCNLRQNCTNGPSNQSKDISTDVNTVLKTDYKTKDDIKTSEKLKGHFKNSLKRKRRSLHRENEDNDKTVIPEVFDVIKDQNIERGELNLPKFNPSDIIKVSDLPDFKAATPHKRDKIEHNQYQPEERRYPINNDKYFARDSNINKENKIYHQSKGEFNPTIQKHRYHDKINGELYLPKTRELTEESAEINVRQDPELENSSYEDDSDDLSDNNYKKGEVEDKNTKAPTNILPRGNIRYHNKKNKNKYHIFKPKKLVDESKEDINKNNASHEEDDNDYEDERFEEDEIDKNRSKPVLQSQNQGYNDDKIKQSEKDNFSYEKGEETDGDFKRNENSQEHKLLHSDRKNEKYNEHKPPLHTPKKSDDYSDEYDETEDDYEDDEDEEESSRDFKKDKILQVNKPSTDSILERHNEQYDNRNKYFPSVQKQDDNNDHSNNDDDEDEYRSEKSETNKNVDGHKQLPNIILQKQNQVYNNENEDSNYYSPEHKNLGDNNERQDIQNNNHYQKQENIDERTENDRDSINENKQLNNKLQTKHELFNVDKNKYPLLKSKNINDESNENYEKQDKEIGYEEDSKELLKNVNKNEVLPTNSAETPLHSYKSVGFRKETNQENEGDLNYTTQPLPGNNGKIRNSPEIRFKSSIDRENPYLLSGERPIFDKNTKFNSNENLSDSRLKDSQIINKNYKNKPNIKQTYDKSEATKEIDLSDFSYDKFRGISNVDKHEPAKVTHQKYETDSLTQSTVRPITKKYRNKIANIRKPKANKQVLNRVITRPVIVSNSENSSEESKKTSNENLSGNFNSIVPNQDNYRKINSNKSNRKATAKKQFKTAPLKQVGTNASPSPVKNSETEGTLDILSPKHNKYDEHLKIKFDDIKIKLPEIKLPENILAYSQEVPDSNNNDAKNNYYNYHNPDIAQYKQKPSPQEDPKNSYHYDPTATTQYSHQPKHKEDKPAEDYDFFASYINKPNEEIKTDEASNNSEIEDGEDLYERFVRERFGRKDSFKERSEKLQEKKLQENRPTTKNKELFDNIQKAIKKAEEVQKEAAKSKDPKANYLWTLEYGEKV